MGDLFLGFLLTLLSGSLMWFPFALFTGLVVFARDVGISTGRDYQRDALRGGWRHQVGVVVPVLGILVVIADGVASYFPLGSIWRWFSVNVSWLPDSASYLVGYVLTLVSFYSFGFISGTSRQRHLRSMGWGSCAKCTKPLDEDEEVICHCAECDPRDGVSPTKSC